MTTFEQWANIVCVYIHVPHFSTSRHNVVECHLLHSESSIILFFTVIIAAEQWPITVAINSRKLLMQVHVATTTYVPYVRLYEDSGYT